MTDINLEIADLNLLFQQITMDILGYDYVANQDAAAYAVRIGWPTEGAPAFKIDEDIAFITVVEKDSSYNRQREMKMTDLPNYNLNMETGHTRVVGVNWVFYGPNSFARAQAVMDDIFYPETQWLLNNSNLYLIPDISSPIRIPELFQSRWWERTDLKMLFNELVIRNKTIRAITSVEAIVENDEGITADVDISIEVNP